MSTYTKRRRAVYMLIAMGISIAVCKFLHLSVPYFADPHNRKVYIFSTAAFVAVEGYLKPYVELNKYALLLIKLIDIALGLGLGVFLYYGGFVHS